MNWSEFFHMGGYAFHVWTSWALSILSLVIIIVVSKKSNSKIKSELIRQYKREERQAEKSSAVD